MIGVLRIRLILTATLLAQLGIEPAGAVLLLVPEEQPTIAAALAIASFADTISIAPGTYYEHDLSWPPGVSILGRVVSADATVIDAQYRGRVLDGAALVQLNELGYLTLRNGDAAGYYGSGLKVIGDPVLHHLIIEECRNSYYGAGLFVAGGATITDCVLRNNRSTAADTYGGGAWLASTGYAHAPMVRGLEVCGNQASSGSGIYFNDFIGHLEGLYVHDNIGSGMVVYNGEVDGIGPTIENSLFLNNTGSGLAFDAGIVLRNCTFVGNGPAGTWVGAIHCGSTWDHPMQPRITQCIVAFNHGSGISWWETLHGPIDCNNVFGNDYADYVNLPNLTGQDGNISTDPLFCSRGGNPYGLHTDSPCAPENNDCGLLMGAFPVACGSTGTEETSWSAVKALY